MNKTDLINHMSTSADLSKADATRALEAVLAGITETLAKGDQVTLVGFGTFVVRSRAARKGRNLHTGEEINIKASKAAGFKAGKLLKDAINT